MHLQNINFNQAQQKPRNRLMTFREFLAIEQAKPLRPGRALGGAAVAAAQRDVLENCKR